ncbi:putative membrane protein (TIGR02226 family) [Humitalea rosea]|uniref:Putative membrane protein (TIGR02226 family) n=1 Tax=Humitalea rosea TaxID=990373 RepID=A0A2W7HZR0_9PROT|nr:DUF4159 domain-containing protein [Humitalea rosea]PZW40026.1 putative membrane protein (TIGR02226 family) [Humitalea rosea]
MLSLGPLAFAAPWVLVALVGLPVLFWLLRVTPPSPRRQSFPVLLLLRGLVAAETTPARTPWWLLLLRIVVAALVIIGLARPVWGPGAGAGGPGPLLLVVDDGWASAPDWAERIAVAQGALEAASREARRVALFPTAPTEAAEPPHPGPLLPAEEARARLAALRPKPWAADHAAAATALAEWRGSNALGDGALSSLWVTTGLAGDGGFDTLATALRRAGPLTLARAEDHPIRLLLAPEAEPERLILHIAQTPEPRPGEAVVLARTIDGRTLARAVIPLEAGATTGQAALDLPIELRNQVTRLDLQDTAGAGGVVLLDERFRRRPVGLIAGDEAGADAELLGDVFWLDRALSPFVELRRGSIETLLSRPLALLILADRPLTPGREQQAVADWVEKGGTLLRFAGPRLAEAADPLLPVPLRAGERALGSALSWEQPQHLAAFPEGSPFAGLPVPEEVLVERQVLAEPVAGLAERTWARLADGTPLVTAENRGRGRIVLVHVTANAAWSNLPLSGLYVDLLRRVIGLSAGVAGVQGGQPLPPLEVLDGFGRLGLPGAAAAAVAGEAIASAAPGPRSPPGWYGAAGEGAERRALNLSAGVPAPVLAALPPGVPVRPIGGVPAEADLGPWLLAMALLLLVLDMLLSLRLRGFLTLRAASLALLLALTPAMAQAEPPEAVVLAQATRLAYVLTGDPTVDEVSRQGLVGLSDFVNRRTAAALAEPVGLVPGRDDLSFFPLIYWPVLPSAQALDAMGAEAVNAFFRNGGIILFDTRDEGSGEGTWPGAPAALRRLTRDLTVPPLAPIADDHVLRRAFYLLPEMPGRFAGGQVWAARDQDRANDSVSPVIIGGHDWAAAWAVDGRGQNPYATIPGGARQRTLAYRFGTNLVMYALTGNYKGDQVHVPAILERLGN